MVAVPLASRALLAEQGVVPKAPSKTPQATGAAPPPSSTPQETGAAPSPEMGALSPPETEAVSSPETAARGLYKRQFLMVPGVPDQFAETTAHFFSDSQLAALRKLCDVLMPPYKGHPGAIDGGVPEFLDFLIGVSPPDRQETYRSGLDYLNADAKKRFGVPFEKVDAAQADAILRPWLRVWTRHHPLAEPRARFLAEAHDDIRRATMNSHAWNVAAAALGDHVPGIGLYWSPIDPDFPNAYTKGESGKRGRGHC